MNNNHRIILNTNKNIIVEFTNERTIPASGPAVVGALLGKGDFIKKLNRMDVTSNRFQHQIKNGDIVLTYLGMLCMGKPYFEAVHEMDDDKDFYKAALGITRSIPFEETLRQRMDDSGDSIRQTILEQNVEMLLANKIQPTALANGLVPVDIKERQDIIILVAVKNNSGIMVEKAKSLGFKKVEDMGKYI